MLRTRIGILTHLATLAAVAAVGAAGPRALGAQEPAPLVTQQGRPATSDSAAAVAVQPRLAVFSRGDLLIASALTAAAGALIPVDATIAREFQRAGPQSNSAINNVADGVEVVGSSGAVIFGASVYAIGLVTAKRGMADFGWHTLEAIVVSTQATSALKGVFGRSRPYAADGNARDFELGAGFGSGTRRSFPSGHTSMAFTFASVVAGETAHRWPSAHRFVAPVAYAAATSVGLARMYNDKHWASDVALGAAIGTLSGRLVVRHAHRRPGNLVDRIGLWRW